MPFLRRAVEALSERIFVELSTSPRCEGITDACRKGELCGFGGVRHVIGIASPFHGAGAPALSSHLLLAYAPPSGGSTTQGLAECI